MGETTAEMQSAIGRFNAGDPKALDDLFAGAAQRLEQIARRMLHYDRVHGREQTGDLVQEAVLRLIRSLATVRVSTPLEFFRLSATMIRRALIDLARHHFGEEGSAANQANVPLGGNSSAPGFTPAETSNDPARLAKWMEFHECVQTLPEDQRAVFDLIWYRQKSQAEVAELLDIAVPTVKRRWHDAKLSVIGVLGDDFPDEL